MEKGIFSSIHVGAGGQPLMLHERASREIQYAWTAIYALADAIGPKGRAAIAPLVEALEALGGITGGDPAHHTSAAPPPAPKAPEPSPSERAREETRAFMETMKGVAETTKRRKEAAEKNGGLGW